MPNTKTVQTTTVQAKPVAIVPVVKQITTTEMVEMLMEQKGAMFVSFTHTADMSKTSKMRKRNNPNFGDCFKTQTVNGTINFHYDKGVLRRLEKEGKDPSSFEQGSSWHEPIFRTDGTLTPFCRHKKDPRRIYVRFMYRQTIGQSYHTADGTEIETSEIEPFLPKRSDYANQGLDKPLIFNVWGIDGITKITMNGETFVVRQDETAKTVIPC